MSDIRQDIGSLLTVGISLNFNNLLQQLHHQRCQLLRPALCLITMDSSLKNLYADNLYNTKIISSGVTRIWLEEGHIGWQRGAVVSGVHRMNEVNLHWVQLVLGWVTVFRRVYHLGL